MAKAITFSKRSNDVCCLYIASNVVFELKLVAQVTPVDRHHADLAER